MSMQVGSADGGEPDVMIEMNTTPLIDVMLVLLIMLIITIPIQTHAVKLDMPAGTPPPALVLPEVVTIDVDFDGSILWNGEAVETATLDQKLRMAAAETVQPELHLRPHRLVSYKYVALVLASAQRLGVNKIGLIGNEAFLD